MSRSSGAPAADEEPFAPQVRREARLVTRVAAGAGVGALVAVPFVLVLALVVAEADWLARLDDGLAEGLHAWAGPRPGVVTALEVVSRVSGPWPVRVVVLFAAALLWRAGSRRLATWAVTTMAIGGILNLLVKLLVQRARPTFAEPVAVADNFSFPSGHAQNSMTGVAVLLLIVLPLLSRRGRVLAWVLGIAAVVVTGFDRVALGVHFLSDVVAGWILALALVAGTVVAFGRPHLRDVAGHGLDATSSHRLESGAPTTRPPSHPANGIPDLLRELRSLLGRLLLRAVGVAVVLTAIGLLIGAFGDVLWPLTIEEEVMRSVAASRTDTWTAVLTAASAMADTGLIVLSVALAAVVLRLVYGRWREGAFLAAGVAVQATAFVATTVVVSRARPEVIMVEAPPTSSFPSGHTGAALVFYLSLALVLSRHTRRRWLQGVVWALLLVPPLAVAVSRVYLGAHFPSDELGSIVAAGLSILVAARVVLTARLTPQLHDVLDTSFRQRHAPVGPEPTRPRADGAPD